jgi:hypothetical protein
LRAAPVRYAIRWMRLTEMVALAASAGGVIAVVARLV